MSVFTQIGLTGIGLIVAEKLADSVTGFVSVTDEGLADAVKAATVVVATTPPSLARQSATQVAPLIAGAGLYADFSAVTPEIKQTLATLFADGAYVDVAVAEPVPGDTENPATLAAAGPRAQEFVDLAAQHGLEVEFVSDKVGDATTRVLLRSILIRGVSAAIVDTLWAAKALKHDAWAYQEILRTFETLSPETARGMLRDTVKNVKPRQIEMMNVSEMLGETEYVSTMSDGIALTYSRLLHSTKVPFSHAP